jgi:hypothetical protein
VNHVSTSPQRATSHRSPRTSLAAADADAALDAARAPASHIAVGVPVLERPASANEPHASAEPTLDEVINGWGESTAREQVRWQLSALNAALRGVEQLGEAQAELSRQFQSRLVELEGQLGEARNLSDLATLQASVARTDFDAVARFCHHLVERGTDQWLHLCQESGNGLVRLQSAYWESALNWFRLQTYFGGDSEMIQAEFEHVLSPMAASPLVWPAQEATRQAAQLAANGWNDWLNWSGHFADAGRTLFGTTAQQER